MRSLSVLLFVFSCFGYAEAPKCDLPTSWAANVASVHLVNDGVFSTEELLHEQTQVTELASENIVSDVYHQIHEIVFSLTSGEKVMVLTANDANSEECSYGPIRVYLIAKTFE